MITLEFVLVYILGVVIMASAVLYHWREASKKIRILALVIGQIGLHIAIITTALR